MAIFDEPSRQPLPVPDYGDVSRAAARGLLAMVPFGNVASELWALLGPPVAQRRDEWLSDLERRLRDLENRVDGFRFDDLEKNDQFVSATLQATQAALRTHQIQKKMALQNVVLNVALARAPSEDLQLVFLNLIDSFTPTHLRMLEFFQSPDNRVRNEFRSQRDLTDQIVRDLNDRGLIKDTRPYVARNRDENESLVYYRWDVTNLGEQFLEFIKSPEAPTT